MHKEKMLRSPHDWGCGALNNTAPCLCGDGLTAEEMEKRAGKNKTLEEKQAERDRKKGMGLDMRESLNRLDEIAAGVKSESPTR
jgi:hypothetical protein